VNLCSTIGMLTFKFTKQLYRTQELLKKLSIPEGTLDFWKAKWTKDGNDTYDMGLRLFGNKAYWDPIVFTQWLSVFRLTNKPTTPEQKTDQEKVILFYKKHVKWKQ